MILSFTKNVVTIEPVLVKREDPGNVASASTLVLDTASTLSSARSVVHLLASAAPSAKRVTECVFDYSVDNMDVVCGVRGVVCSLGPTPPSPPVLKCRISCKYKPLYYKFNII